MSIVSSAAPTANCCGNMRRRKASRPFHSTFRTASNLSSSRAEKGGNAPGKLAVARAAKTSSGKSARSLRPRVEKSMVIRCSDSVTCGGLLRRSIWSWPLKSVTVTNRSSGCPVGSSLGPVGDAAIASSASNNKVDSTRPPNGGANQRARTKRDSLLATSSRTSSETVRSTAPPLRRNMAHAIGVAQNFEKRDKGLASGSSRVSTSPFSSHMSVNGSSDWPVTIACDRKMPFIPPALDPATISASTRSLVPLLRAISAIRSW